MFDCAYIIHENKGLSWIDDLIHKCDETCCLKKLGLGKCSELCLYEVSGKNGVPVEFSKDQDCAFPYECEF